MTALLGAVLVLGLIGCTRTDPATEKELAKPVVPDGFDEKALANFKCPENGSKLRLATKKELTRINERIAAQKMKRWFDNSIQEDYVDAVLVREDSKIGYRVDGIVPALTIEEALMLDEKVGPPLGAKKKK